MDYSFKLKSVKLWLVIGLVALFTSLLCFKQVDQNIFKDMMFWLVSGYFLANVTTKFSPQAKALQQDLSGGQPLGTDNP